MWKVCPAGLTRRARRTTKIHEEETADFADWSRLGAGCRRQDCQNGKRRCSVASLGRPYGISQIWADFGRAGARLLRLLIRKGEGKGKEELGRCGALPHAPAGEGRLMPPRRTENREQNARQARDGEVVGCGAEPHRENQASKPLNFQANCPCTPGTSATCQLARRNSAEESKLPNL